MYADYTNSLSLSYRFQCETTPSSSLSINIHNELATLSKWIAVNKLSLNINKTKSMGFHATENYLPLTEIPNIMVNNQPIVGVESGKFILILIDKIVYNHQAVLVHRHPQME